MRDIVEQDRKNGTIRTIWCDKEGKQTSQRLCWEIPSYLIPKTEQEKSSKKQFYYMEGYIFDEEKKRRIFATMPRKTISDAFNQISDNVREEDGSKQISKGPWQEPEKKDDVNFVGYGFRGMNLPSFSLGC